VIELRGSLFLDVIVPSFGDVYLLHFKAFLCLRILLLKA